VCHWLRQCAFGGVTQVCAGEAGCTRMVMIRDSRSVKLIWSAACLALVALVGCARPVSTDVAATEVIMPGEQKLTPPEAVAAPASEPAESKPAESAATPSETKGSAEPQVAATTPAAEAGAATPAAEPAVPSATPAAGESTGTEFAAFKGRVKLDGSFPALPPLKAAGDPSVQDKACVLKAIPDDSVIVSADGGLANVFVFAKKLPAGVKAPPPPTDPVVLDQKGCRFVPQALVFRAGQPLLMKNSDPVSHNVRTTAIAMAINQILTPNNTTGIDVTYKKPERMPVQTRCDIHAWMLAYHFPLDHPYAAVTDADGKFEIKDLPPGDWEFVVWHGRAGNIERSFKFKATAGQALTQDFSVPVGNLSK
jgi:hypothetical protein